jgi:farnesyl diphosphate synthase
VLTVKKITMKGQKQMTTTTDITLDELFQLCSTRLKDVFFHSMQDIPSFELKKAMEYSLLSGGKHIRPLLIYATGFIFNAPWENLDIPACSVELIHTYSLIHDDLPCMDNANLRRGKPTLHNVNGEGMAVLAGDALHTLAMQLIADYPAPLEAEKRLQMIKTLTYACGPYGMAAGQALDITVMNDESISSDLLIDIYRLKTGALFAACIELGRLASGNDDEVNQNALKEFGDCIGLAFQIQDDILDIEATTQSLGKPQGIDEKNKKITYPKLMGIKKAQEKVEQLYQEALQTINYLGYRAKLLRELTGFVLLREKSL